MAQQHAWHSSTHGTAVHMAQQYTWHSSTHGTAVHTCVPRVLCGVHAQRCLLAQIVQLEHHTIHIKACAGRVLSCVVV
jgi:hypothetical protein